MHRSIDNYELSPIEISFSSHCRQFLDEASIKESKNKQDKNLLVFNKTNDRMEHIADLFSEKKYTETVCKILRENLFQKIENLQDIRKHTRHIVCSHVKDLPVLHVLYKKSALTVFNNILTPELETLLISKSLSHLVKRAEKPREYLTMRLKKSMSDEIVSRAYSDIEAKTIELVNTSKFASNEINHLDIQIHVMSFLFQGYQKDLKRLKEETEKEKTFFLEQESDSTVNMQSLMYADKAFSSIDYKPRDLKISLITAKNPDRFDVGTAVDLYPEVFERLVSKPGERFFFRVFSDQEVNAFLNRNRDKDIPGLKISNDKKPNSSLTNQFEKSGNLKNLEDISEDWEKIDSMFEDEEETE